MTSLTKFVIIAAVIILGIAGYIFLASQDTDPNTKENTSTNNEEGAVLGADSESSQDTKETKSVIEKIDAIRAKELVATEKDDPNFKIIDIRTKEEFDAGNIEGSINIDFYGDFETEIAKLDPSHKYLIYCRSGNRSGQAMAIFQKFKFQQIYDLDGGYSAWISQ
ncbi:MAG TPA: rhodanese-like domain-containing protein [bacterium]|nr:rhodanese-like domain-containing protein [bacterium]